MPHQGPGSILIMACTETSLANVFLISKLFLIYPLKLDKTGFQRSPWLATCCTAHLFFLICGTIRCYVKRPMTVGGFGLINVVLNIQITTMVYSLSLSVVCYMLSANRLTVIQRDLKDIDILLYNYLTPLDIGDSFECTRFFHNAYDLLIFCFSTLFVCVVDLLSFQDEIFGTLFLYWTFLLTQIVMYQFPGLMDIFLVRITILNQRLDGVMHLKLPPLRILIRLIKIYRRLSESVLEANRIYSLQLLSYFFSNFFGLAANCFFFTYPSDSDSFRYIGMNLVLVSWLFLLFFNFYSILHRTHDVIVEAKEFNTRLYQLMLCDKTGLLLNDTTLRLQIASKRDIEFTAAGFFKLDLTLLVAMVGAMTTYGVILIQISQRKTE